MPIGDWENESYDYKQPTNWNINSVEGQETLDSLGGATGTIDEPQPLENAFYLVKKYLLQEINSERDSDKRLDVMSVEGINIQGKQEKYYNWDKFLEDIMFIENVEGELKDMSFVGTKGTEYEGISIIAGRKYKNFKEQYFLNIWKSLTAEVGRWERMQDGWNVFWSEAGETVGGAVGGVTEGVTKGIFGEGGIAKVLMIGGLVVVGIVLFVSSDRGTKTAQNVGQVTAPKVSSGGK